MDVNLTDSGATTPATSPMSIVDVTLETRGNGNRSPSTDSEAGRETKQDTASDTGTSDSGSTDDEWGQELTANIAKRHAEMLVRQLGIGDAWPRVRK